MLWYKTQQFKAYVYCFACLWAGYFSAGFINGHWGWWHPYAGSSVLFFLGILKDWASPEVVSPLAIMNRSNIVSVPPASVAAATKEEAAK